MNHLPILLAAAAVALAGCASPSEEGPADADPRTRPTDPAPTTASSDGPLVHAVQEGDANFFDPETLRVSRGTAVTWDIVGRGHHTVDFLQPIDAAGETPKSGDLGPGQTFGVTFTEPGTYRYYCKYHSNKETGMTGTIVVE